MTTNTVVWKRMGSKPIKHAIAVLGDTVLSTECGIQFHMDCANDGGRRCKACVKVVKSKQNGAQGADSTCSP